MQTLSQSRVLAAVDRKIKYAFGISKDAPSNPEALLMSNIVMLAVYDLYGDAGWKPKKMKKQTPAQKKAAEVVKRNARINKTTALRYLKSDMPHACLCGIDPDYIRRILKGFGFDLSQAKVMGGGIFAPVDKSGWVYG